MKTFTLLSTLFIFVVLSACNEEEILIDSSNPLIGTWVEPAYTENQVTYQRVKKLQPNNYGISILPENKLVERKNSGWCGTPPISYTDFDGSWQIQDSLVNIQSSYWGGKLEHQWKIVAVNNQTLTVEVIE